MTKDEAIEWLEDIKNVTENWSQDVAIDMAIESLRADTVSRSQYQGLLNAIGKVYVEVVRCKDCKNNYNTCTNHGINQPMCDFTDRMLKETDFCSRGERREE